MSDISTLIHVRTRTHDVSETLLYSGNYELLVCVFPPNSITLIEFERDLFNFLVNFVEYLKGTRSHFYFLVIGGHVHGLVNSKDTGISKSMFA